MELSVSGVGVIDKAALVLGAVEDGGASLNELVERTGLSRATAHRLASALEVHGLLVSGGIRCSWLDRIGGFVDAEACRGRGLSLIHI